MNKRIRKEILIETHPDMVWAAVRDVGAIHQRLALGFVVDVCLDGDTRVVTFANGAVVRELIDDIARRFVYAAVQGRAKHLNARSTPPDFVSCQHEAVDAVRINK